MRACVSLNSRAFSLHRDQRLIAERFWQERFPPGRKGALASLMDQGKQAETFPLTMQQRAGTGRKFGPYLLRHHTRVQATD